MRLQNVASTSSAANTSTMGVFKQGELPAGSGIHAVVDGQVVAAQLDVKTRHADGSAETAIISFRHGGIPLGGDLDVAIVRGAVPSGPAIDLAARLNGYSLDAVIHSDATGKDIKIDLGAALQNAIANGTASFWQQGSEVSNARVDVHVTGSLRLVADISANADGTFKTSVQFANDVTMGKVGGAESYTATILQNDQVAFQHHVDQRQYQTFRVKVGTDGEAAHVQHDLNNLIETGVVANYNAAYGVSENLLQKLAADAASPGYNDPLAVAGITQYMPMTGGRSDIGMTTSQNSAWLISQDYRAASAALGQAEASGSAPWHHWDAVHGSWVSTDNYPRLWTDGRGGTGTPGDSQSGGLTQQVDGGDWVVEGSHQPDLTYVPYMLTGDRYYLDGLQAQAAWGIISVWTDTRGDGHDLVVNGNQVRGAAWGLRELVEAAFASPEGSKERAYFQQAVAENIDFLVSKIPEWTAIEGETHGWMPQPEGFDSGLKAWQQDHLATSVAAAIRLLNGDMQEKAVQFLKWQENYLVGRFENGANGFHPHDGAAYYLPTTNPNGSIINTWAQMGAAAVREDVSNGNGWEHSQGNYASLALNTLAILAEVLDSSRARAAYTYLKGENAPFTSDFDQSSDPLSLTTPDSAYVSHLGTTQPGTQPPVTQPPVTQPPVTQPSETQFTSGDDTVTLTGPQVSKVIDMLGGYDTLNLSAQGGSYTLSNVERIYGGSGNDKVTVMTPGMVEIDLGTGNDTLVLGVEGVVAFVKGAETIVGSTGADTMMVSTISQGVSVDLGAGKDTLFLSGIGHGANSITTTNVESIYGSMARDVVYATGASIVDLGEGNDRLELAKNSANTVSVSNVEAILGGAKADQVSLVTVANGVSIDLGNGIDTLRLQATGSNVLSVSNVENLFGSAGDDTVTVRTAGRGMVFDLGDGKDHVILSNAASTIKVSNTEMVTGGDGADGITVTGATAATVFGGKGNDVITGGDGNDTIWGGLGKDVMTGGAGMDRFMFGALADSDLNTRDIITDFQVGMDKLVFQNLLHGSFSFIGEGNFTGSGHTEARFLDASDQLLIDTDGNGQMDMRMTLTGVDGHLLSANDFIWS